MTSAAPDDCVSATYGRRPNKQKGAPLSWESHRLIENLLYRYARCVDLALWDELGRLFTHARVQASTSDHVSHGADEVAALWASTNKVHTDGTLRTRHLVTNVIIDIDESAGTATAESYFMSFQATNRTPLQPIAGGRYSDRFRRIDGVWWFADRFIKVDQMGDVSDNLNWPSSS
jgi:3-phenylpropionate/cinnamic acid dioxygenase small subunit